MSRARTKHRPRLVNGRLVSPAQAALLKSAARAEAAGRPAQARQLRLRLEAEIARGADRTWLEGALAETAALERARGVALERSGGKVRLIGRDGLAGLRAAGAITSSQHAAGVRYRDCFERTCPRQGSTLAVRPGGSGEAGLSETIALRLAGARRALHRMEQEVAAAYIADGRPALARDGLMVLREVAGLGRSVRSLGASGSRRTALTERLGEALEALARLAAGARGQDR